MASAQPVAMSSAHSTSHPYTCNTCQVAYRNIDLQKVHMKSDWHRYNLKRRVASLPPVSADTFTEKVIQARAESTAKADKAYFERTCDACLKTYFSENAYQNHLLSQKHKNKVARASVRQPHDDETTSVVSSTFSLGEPIPNNSDDVNSDVEEEFSKVVEGLQTAKISPQGPSPVKRPSNPQPASGLVDNEDIQATEDASDDGDPTDSVRPSQEASVSAQNCLFCNYASPTTVLNAHHMERFHGMFVPEKAYLVDLDGLVRHLQRKIHQDHECLSCGKIKSTVFGVQTHMRDKGHCIIPYSTEVDQLEIGDYYDFRSTYSDGEEDDSDSEEGDQGGARLGARRPTRTLESTDPEQGEDEGWETDTSESSLDSADLAAVPAEGHIHQFERLDKHPHHSRSDPRHRHQRDGWHSHAHKHTHAVFYDDYELHLPSGKSVGHRSLNKYYRQNLGKYPTAEERAERAAITQGSEENGDLSDDEAPGILARNGRGREVAPPRGSAGMVGVSDQSRRGVRRAEERGRTAGDAFAKRRDLSYSTKLNNHKSYYYRFRGGG